MSIFERFNPADEKYKELEDLPRRKQKQFKKAEGGGFVRKEALDTPEEAMLQQDYATSLEGVDFSEMVDGESMKEAEKIYEELKDAKFDFSSIQWEKLHLEGLKYIKNPKERAKAAYDRLMSFDDPRILELRNRLKNSEKNGTAIVIGLIILAYGSTMYNIHQGAVIADNDQKIIMQDKEIHAQKELINKQGKESSLQKELIDKQEELINLLKQKGHVKPKEGIKIIIPDSNRDLSEKDL